MKKIVLVVLFFFLVGCFNDSNSDKDSTTTEQEYNSGARVVTTSTELPICNANKKGELYYILDSTEFKYCDGSTYQAINLIDAGTRRMKIKDSLGSFLGYVVSLDFYNMYLMTLNGYYYKIDWYGKYTRGVFGISYSEPNCGGTAYITSYLPCSKALYYGTYLNKYYAVKTFNSNGLPYSATVTLGSREENETFNNTPYTTNAIELVEISKFDLGLPENIIPPLNVVYE